MIILGLDYGLKTIGAAILETKLLYAYPINSFSAKKSIFLKKIDFIIQKWCPKYIIVGYPLNLQGKKQSITKKTELFIKNLKKKYNIKIIKQDERFTTIEAKNLQYNQENHIFFKKKCIHSLSAKIILESWVEHISKK